MSAPRLTDVIYQLLYFPILFVAVLTHAFRMRGRDRVPATGPVLLIGNHQSFLDILLMGLACRRRIYFLAKKPLFENRLLGWVMDLFGTVAVDIEGFSRAGLEGIRQELQKGHVVLIYPEGERSWDGKLGALKPGVSLMIRRAKCPIVPVGIAGAFDAWPRTRRSIRFAPPFLSWNPARIAVAVGTPLDGAALAEMERVEMLNVMTDALKQVVAEAERLRGKR